MSSELTDGQYGAGSMSAQLVAGLAGVPPVRLKRWRRSGLVPASALPPRRGQPCAYRWDEYRRARLAALLLSHGMQPRNLRKTLDDYCKVIAPSAELPTTVAGQQAIVKHEDGRAHTANPGRQGAMYDLVLAAALGELKSSWPLGTLQEFADIIDVRPEVAGGAPTLKGRRLETAILAMLHQAGETVESIVDAYQLARATVERALAFEKQLEAYASAAG